MLYEFNYLAPESVSELLSTLSKNESYKILAGGTDLLIDIRAGIKKPVALVDIKKVRDLEKLVVSEKEGMVIGPAVTISDILTNKSAQKHYPVLVQAGHQLGSHQVRNRATVIGNICNASPCSDMSLALLCLDASVVISSLSGSRTVKVNEFITGVKKTVLKSNEIVEKLIIGPEMQNLKSGFKKLKRIKGHDLSLVSVCLVKKGKVLRIAIGSAAPTPVLLPEFSAGAPAKSIANQAAKAVDPIDDIRCSRDYRLYMIKTYIERLLKEIK